MNNKKRDRLSDAIRLLREAYDVINSVDEDENECLDNMPENLMCSDRYQKLEDNCGNLSCALDNIDSAIDEIESAKS